MDYDDWRQRARKSLLIGDEFTRYIKPTDTDDIDIEEEINPITWWSTAAYPSIRQWAFDTLSCPTTSCECEPVFSSTKKLITPSRNHLEDDSIEASECLKAWFDRRFIKDEEGVF
jgi:hypothetical protein